MCRVMDEAINSGIEKGRKQGELIRSYEIANRYMERFGGTFEEALNLAEISEAEYYQGKELKMNGTP